MEELQFILDTAKEAMDNALKLAKRIRAIKPYIQFWLCWLIGQVTSIRKG